MWKELAKKYLEFSIKYEVYASLDKELEEEDPSLNAYLKYLDEEVDFYYGDLSVEIIKLDNSLLEDPLCIINTYYDCLNWDKVMKERGGLENAIKGACLWIDAISIFFIED